MRKPTLSLSIMVVCAGPVAAPAAAPAAPPALEQAWHACVRQAYDAEPAARGKAAAQRDALDACRAQEDAYVAAVMAARAEEDRPVGARARAWAASVAAYVVEPASDWLGRLSR